MGGMGHIAPAEGRQPAPSAAGTVAKTGAGASPLDEKV